VSSDFESLKLEPIHQLKKRLFAPGFHITEEMLHALSTDPRKSARQLAHQIQKYRIQLQREDQRLDRLLRFETELYGEGYMRIAGVDEAGVAPLAGPVVAAAVILPRNYKLPGLDDSKKILDERKRESLARQIKEDAICWATGKAEVEEIDRLNIYQSGLLSMQRAVEGLSVKPDYILVDARTIPQCPYPQKGIIHGDALSSSIAAASLIAKTTRDSLMAEFDRLYPGYGFARHKGYPTPEHLRLLEKLGPVLIHRKSFAPVRKAMGMDPSQRILFSNSPFDPGAG
jgi:ribonuclease HII